jgi:hypothetical protein
MPPSPSSETTSTSTNNPTTSTTKDGDDVRKKIGHDLNERAGLAHNYGKPKKAPHAEKESTTARYLTNCATEHTESLQCIERNYQNRAACEPFFKAYKACRVDENEERKAANQRASQSGSGGWFW